MSLVLEGVEYYTMKDAVCLLSVSRQTIWRWRRDRKIPQGQLFRQKHLLFTSSEFRQIAAFANRLEPVPPNRLQLGFLSQSLWSEPASDPRETKRHG